MEPYFWITLNIIPTGQTTKQKCMHAWFFFRLKTFSFSFIRGGSRIVVKKWSNIGQKAAERNKKDNWKSVLYLSFSVRVGWLMKMLVLITEKTVPQYNYPSTMLIALPVLASLWLFHPPLFSHSRTIIFTHLFNLSLILIFSFFLFLTASIHLDWTTCFLFSKLY